MFQFVNNSPVNIYTLYFYTPDISITNMLIKYDQNLGYLLGYRIVKNADNTVPTDLKITLDPSPAAPVVANTQPDLLGTKYFRLIIDDFNPNRTNIDVGIENNPPKASMPSYANKIDPSNINPFCTNNQNNLTFVQVNLENLLKLNSTQ